MRDRSPLVLLCLELIAINWSLLVSCVRRCLGGLKFFLRRVIISRTLLSYQPPFFRSLLARFSPGNFRIFVKIQQRPVEPSSIHSNSLFFRLSQFRSFAKTEDANPRSKVGTSVDTYYFERRDRGEFFDEGGVPGRAKFRSEESPCCFLRDAVTTVRTFPKLLFSRNY